MLLKVTRKHWMAETEASVSSDRKKKGKSRAHPSGLAVAKSSDLHECPCSAGTGRQSR